MSTDEALERLMSTAIMLPEWIPEAVEALRADIVAYAEARAAGAASDLAWIPFIPKTADSEVSVPTPQPNLRKTAYDNDVPVLVLFRREDRPERCIENGFYDVVMDRFWDIERFWRMYPCDGIRVTHFAYEPPMPGP